MEHEEIDLHRKQNNSRETKGRFGVKTNKTLKFDRSVLRKQNETIAIVDSNDTPTTYTWRPRLDIGVGISLNAHKNWEILDKNHLRSSRDDIDVNYCRVADLDFNNVYYKANHQGEFYRQVYGTNKNDHSHEHNEEEPEIITGTNRKGFFVKQKRKKGKRGVKGYSSDGDSTNTQKGRKNKSRSRDSSSSESDSDSDREKNESKEKPEVLVIVQRHKHGKPKHQSFHGPSKCGLFNCDMCAEEEMMKERQHDTSPRTNRAIKSVNLDVLNL